jgi:hypothetical protein
MIGKIFRIDNMKSSRNPGEVYQRVHFEIPNGDSIRYAHTDIVKTYRNYKNWVGLLEVGNILGNLAEWKEGKINADSHPHLIKREEIVMKPSTRVEPVKNLKLL